MTRKIYTFICKSLDSIKQNTDLFVKNVNKNKGPVIKASAASLLLLFCIYKSIISSSGSSLKSLNTQNVVLEATLDYTCDGTPPHYKVLPEVIQATTECSAPQSEQIIPSLVENVNTEV